MSEVSIFGTAPHALVAHPVTHENARGRYRDRNRRRAAAPSIPIPIAIPTPTFPAVVLFSEQEIFYVVEGAGTISGGGATYDLFPGVVVLVPEKLEFSITNIGDGELAAYLDTEPTKPGFKPRDGILWRDENAMDYSSTDAHRVERVKTLVGPGDGLATLDGCYSVTLPPNTCSQPHSHRAGEEVAWVAVDGDGTVFLGKQLRELPEGCGYLVPPDNATPHANMNVGKVPVKRFYFISGIRGR